MENQNNKTEKDQVKPDGIDQWNDRLDENLEPEKEGDVTADEKAREFSEKEGSGDQSDEGEV
ncbi:MAG: hypothetical protein ABWY16_17515 [Pedobacter sp.]|uniref:hypothetical protein n=1 Tax=Pedobacter sp. TaxID=1411316 RepID=UPI003391482F